MPHLFVDISAHGYGHLAQAAPVLHQLTELMPNLRLTLRCGLPATKLRQRIRIPFAHLPAASDFGYAMIDAMTVDHAGTAAAYRAAHADFPTRVAAEAEMLRQLQPDAVFSDVSYLPLAGAAQAGIPAVALCSLNWADLFAHYYGNEAWAAPIHAEMLAAYRTATFLRTTPAMPMPHLPRQIEIGAIACMGCARRDELRAKVGCGDTARIVLVGLGGIPARLPVENWPVLPDTCWLLPAAWLADRRPPRADFHAIESFGWPFEDWLRSIDAVVAKPGYGTFTEAVCNGTAVVFQRRDDWPEQDCLVKWLQRHGRCAEVSAAQLASGDLGPALSACLQAAVPPAPTFDGAGRAARHLAALLS
jgi:hypothetical protein